MKGRRQKVNEFYQYGTGSFQEKEHFIHSDEFNEESMPQLGESGGEPLEAEDEPINSLAGIAKAALTAIIGTILIMQVAHPHWMLIPDPVRESIGIGKHQHLTSGEWITDPEPTCTENGLEYMLCTVCGEKAEEKELPAKGHVISSDWVTDKEATCETAGSEVRKCTVCGEALETREIPAPGHQFPDKWTVKQEPTCIEKGIEARECTVCGKEETRELDLIPHKYETKTNIRATCTEPGYKIEECTMCGDQKRTNYPATGHSFVAAFDPTGYAYAYCTKCGKTARELGYRYETVTIATAGGGSETVVRVYINGNEYVDAHFQ